MPIYGYHLIAEPWVLENQLRVKDLLKLQKYLKAALDKEFPDDVNFRTSIRMQRANSDGEYYSYIASFDYSKSNIDQRYYTQKMERLINEANKAINTNRKEKIKYSNYKFDILGSWSTGFIIIMKRNEEAGYY